MERYLERFAVAKILIKNVLGVRKVKVYCDEIIIPTVSISRATGVDKKTVIQTTKMIEGDLKIRITFKDEKTRIVLETKTETLRSIRCLKKRWKK